MDMLPRRLQAGATEEPEECEQGWLSVGRWRLSVVSWFAACTTTVHCQLPTDPPAFCLDDLGNIQHESGLEKGQCNARANNQQFWRSVYGNRCSVFRVGAPACGVTGFDRQPFFSGGPCC